MQFNTRPSRTIDSSHDESDLGRIRCAGKVGIDLLGVVLIQAHESIQNVVTCGSIIRSTCLPVRRAIFGRIRQERASSKPGMRTFVVREIVLHGAHWKLLLEAINLVQEQNNTRLGKPSGITDAVEEGEGFLHPVHRFIFE